MGSIDFQKVINDLKEIGFNPIPNLVRVNIPNAREVLWSGLKYYEGEKAVWLNEYNEIADWLTENNGKGLLCYGNCGRGKSLICWKIIPLLLNYYHGKIISCYDSLQMNSNIDEVKSKHLIYIDDIGIENVSIKFGERRLAFSEIVDESEKRGKLLIVTTNLSLDELAQKYGERTMDRLVAITKRVKFIGESLRK